MATRTIAIRGIILDARYDAAWLDGMIGKGIFTPESRVRSELEAARKAGDDVEIVVSSQGGSVFAGIEMSNAIRAFARDHKLEVTVGAFAASAAAMIVLDAANSGIAVHAHRNSILLYHGAWSVTEGGSGAHEDSAKMLEQINGIIIDGLKARNVPEEAIAAGFGEGRQLTMTAAEAQSYGIVTDIVDALAERSATPDDSDLEVIHENGLQFDLAAWSADADAQPADAKPYEPPAFKPQPADALPAAPAAPADSPSVGALLAQVDALNAQLRSLQSTKDREIARCNGEAIAALEEAHAERDAIAAEFSAYRQRTEATLNDLNAKLAAAAADAEQARARHASLVGAVNAPAAEDAAPQTWQEAIDRFGLQDAARLYPSLARQYRESRR